MQSELMLTTCRFVKSKDPAPAPKVISIPAMQKSAWPKPSVDEAIDCKLKIVEYKRSQR
jgi:hypothetical protein